VLDAVGVDIVDRTLLSTVAANKGNDPPTEDDHEDAKQMTLATRFIRSVNSKHELYLKELRHSQLNGNDDYPTTLSDAYNILQRRQPDVTPAIHHDGLSFLLSEGLCAGTNGITYPNITCRRCRKTGHYGNYCPDRVAEQEPAAPAAATGNPEGAQNTHSCSFSQLEKRKFTIPKTWVLLDNQSTVDIFYNHDLLQNIRTVNERMYIHCNAGIQWTNQQGDLPGYGRVWYCPSAIANILSLHNVQNRCRVVYDSTAGNRFVVTRSDGTERVFRMSDNGLYYFDTATSAWASSSLLNTVLVNTVSENKARYTNAEVSRAEVARALQSKIGRPSTREFIQIVNNNLLPNCPVTQRDILAAEDIFGPDIGSLKGKTVRRRPHPVTTDLTYSPLPPTVHERYREVTLCADVMHVNGIPFFVSISRHLKFGTIEAISNQRLQTIVKCVRNISRVYHRGGFRVRHALTDGAFESMRGDLLGMGILLNTTSRDEHVGDIERYIRTVKERMRCSYNSVPFERVPSRMVVELASREVFCSMPFLQPAASPPPSVRVPL
jgi:hypothetical protein